jgi:hypothetical protein
MREFTTEQLTDRFESQRQIKNLMGKYANLVILNREQDIFEMFWSKEADDLYLGFNDGCYKGRKAVDNYYKAVYERNALVAKLLSERFPEKLGSLSEEERYGIGPFKVKPMACPIIEIAADGKTAKGLWTCQGAYNEVEEAGPVAYWTWGYFAVDFVKEGEDWKIWHLLYVNDVDSLCGQSWGKEQKKYPPLPEFAALADFTYPEYTQKKQIRVLYTPERPLTPAPQMPQEYETFAETFSYAV